MREYLYLLQITRVEYYSMSFIYLSKISSIMNENYWMNNNKPQYSKAGIKRRILIPFTSHDLKTASNMTREQSLSGVGKGDLGHMILNSP
jgi:hypothetical protein